MKKKSAKKIKVVEVIETHKQKQSVTKQPYEPWEETARNAYRKTIADGDSEKVAWYMSARAVIARFKKENNIVD